MAYCRFAARREQNAVRSRVDTRRGFTSHVGQIALPEWFKVVAMSQSCIGSVFVGKWPRDGPAWRSSRRRRLGRARPTSSDAIDEQNP